MKKILLYLMFSGLGMQQLSAQTTLTTAVDFTATDDDGNTFNLYNTLNSGKYVVLDFMFTSCGPCQNAAPKFYQAFVNYGSNSPMAQIHFVSINRDDNNAVMHSWVATYENPTGPYPQGISGTQGSATAGPQSFDNLYGIGAYPTFILIAPDKTIIEQDMWPISTAADFTAFFQAHGLNPSTAGINDVSTNAAISIYPTPAQNEITVNANAVIEQINIVDVLGNVVIAYQADNMENTAAINVAKLSSGIYYAVIKTGAKESVTRKFLKM